METDALIVAAAMKYFGLDSLEVAVEEVIPPNVLKSSKPDRRIWLHKHVKKIVEMFVMTEQQSKHTEIRCGVENAARPPQKCLVSCHMCGKEYRYRKALANHLAREHPEEDMSQEEEKRSPVESGLSSDKSETDDRFNYACVRLGLGLLLRNFDDSIKEGDGERILRCWKIALLIYRAYGHTKYALASFLLQASTKATLTARNAHCLVWNRTVNNKGGLGRNIPLDLRLEHINNLTKGMLKHLGVNITENAARRCSKSVARIESLLDEVDNDLNVQKRSGHHKVRKSEADFKTLVNELHVRGKVFHFNPGQDRQYQHFPHFRKNILADIDHRLLNNWLTRLKKELARLE